MSTNDTGAKNHKVAWGLLITLLIGIFGFAQVYLILAINQMDDRISRLENRMDKRFTEIENKIETLNQNYIDHLKYHLEKK